MHPLPPGTPALKLIHSCFANPEKNHFNHSCYQRTPTHPHRCLFDHFHSQEAVSQGRSGRDTRVHTGQHCTWAITGVTALGREQTPWLQEYGFNSYMLWFIFIYSPKEERRR